MNDRPALRLGIIGCGRATRELHLPAIARVSGIEAVALADTNPTALAAAADASGAPARYTDHRGLLEDDAVEVVAVCVPAAAHEEVAVDAMRTGKHVLVEKPLALDLAACDRLVEAAADAPGRVLVGYNLRHHRLVRDLAELLRAGGAGAIEAIRSTWTSAVRHSHDLPAWRDRRAEGGGALFEIATHHVDLWRFLTGAEVETVFAVGHGRDTDDETVALTATLTNGVVVNALFSERTAHENTLVVYGREARITLDPFRFDGLTVDAVGGKSGIAARLGRLAAFAEALPAGLASARIGGEFCLSYDHEWAHVRDVIAGDAAAAVTVEDGRRAVAVALAAMASLESGRPVRVEDAPWTAPPPAYAAGHPAQSAGGVAPH